MKKILLLNPPYYVLRKNINFYPSFPIGIGYLASYLEKNGHIVKVIDAFGEGYENRAPHENDYLRIGISNEEILSEMSKFSPDLIGISNLFSMQHFAMHRMAGVIKEQYSKNIPIVVGGPHISAVPELVMQDKNIDYGIIGEGERSLSELIDAISNVKDFKAIDGIVYRDREKVVINRPVRIIENPDDIPFPAWHLFKMEKYLNQEISHGGLVETTPFMTILTSRGCPLNCSFCSVRDTWGRRFRARSPENVIKEILVLREKFGIKELIIVDDNFNLNVERINAILDFLIDKKMDLELKAPNGFFLQKLNKDILFKMKKAGFRKVYFPIESGNEYVLKNIIRKPVNLQHIKELVDYSKQIELDIMGYFIIGLPGETKEQMRDTFRLIKKLKIKAYFSVATPFPGSDLYKISRDSGLLKSYEMDKCSDEYNITTSEWSTEELRKFKQWEMFKLDWKSGLTPFVKKPFKMMKMIKRQWMGSV